MSFPDSGGIRKMNKIKKIGSFLSTVLILFTFLVLIRCSPFDFAKNEEDNIELLIPKKISNSETWSTSPKMAVGSDGVIYLAWIESDYINTFDPRIVFSISENFGRDFSAPETIFNSFKNKYRNKEYNVEIELDEYGVIYIVFTDFFGDDRSDVFLLRSLDKGSTWTNAQNISNSSEFSSFSQIESDLNGNLYLLWSDSSFLSLFYILCSKDRGENWERFEIADPHKFKYRFGSPVSLVANQNGFLYAGGGNQFTSSTDYGETWVSPIEVFSVDSTSWLKSKLRIDRDGNMVIVWSFGDYKDHIYFSRSTDNGLNWSSPEQIPFGLTEIGYTFFDFGFNPAGEICVVASIGYWKAFDEYKNSIFFVKSGNNGIDWSEKVNLDSLKIHGRSVNDPEMVVDKSGNIYIVWEKETNNENVRFSDIYFIKLQQSL